MKSPRPPAPSTAPSGAVSSIRRWRRSITGLALLLLIGLSVIGYYAAKLGRDIVRGPNQGRQIDFAADPAPPELAALGVSRQLRVDVGPPAASLSVWIVDPQPPATPRATVFVLHGINDSKDHHLDRAQRVAGAGYRAVLPDLRSHGRSTGQYLTYGAIESTDMKQLADALDSQRLLVGPIAAWGHSYGGATAIEWAAKDDRVRTVVSSDAFCSMSDVLSYLAPRYTPPLLRWTCPFIMPLAVRRAGREAGFDPADASPEWAAAHTHAPILIIHADGDSFIPPSHAQRICRNASTRSHLVILSGGEHNTVLSGPMADQVWAQVEPWLTDHLLANPTPEANAGSGKR
jgi:pimeloyl-ACP methyl ester carboxylesterase